LPLSELTSQPTSYPVGAEIPTADTSRTLAEALQGDGRARDIPINKQVKDLKQTDLKQLSCKPLKEWPTVSSRGKRYIPEL
jgi:hypothetical protein